MKKSFVFVLFFVLLSSFLLAEDTTPVVAVTGKGEIKAVPDIVVIRLAAQTDNKDLEKAKKENDSLADRLVKALKKGGVDKKDIQTGQVSIEPRYAKRYEEKGFAGFFVTRHITAELTDIDKFDKLLSELVGEGADRIQGIEFKTSEETKLLKKARLMAVKAAKEKAEELAGEIGQSIGKAVRINENRVYAPRSANKSIMVAEAGGSGQDTFEPGQIVISPEVYCEFVLK